MSSDYSYNKDMKYLSSTEIKDFLDFQVVDLKTASEITGLDMKCLRNKIFRKSVDFVKIGCSILIPVSELERLKALKK